MIPRFAKFFNRTENDILSDPDKIMANPDTALVEWFKTERFKEGYRFSGESLMVLFLIAHGCISQDKDPEDPESKVTLEETQLFVNSVRMLYSSATVFVTLLEGETRLAVVNGELDVRER